MPEPHRQGIKFSFAASAAQSEDELTDDLIFKGAEHQDEFHGDEASTAPHSPIHRQQSNGSRASSSTGKKSHRKRTISDASYFSSSSLSRTSSTSSTSYSFSAPDGGWGWVIVAASFVINMIADGVTFSFGVLFMELEKEFAESKAVTAGVVSLFHSVPLLSGPIASALTDRYGCRKMTILGSILATIGFLLSTVCHRIELLYLTFGLISGFGLSLCYVAAIVIVAYYFDRRRSFATGISVCGSGVGTFVFAPLTKILIEYYGGWRQATIILAAFFLHMCICGALFRDLEWTRKIKRSRKASSHRKESFGSVSSQSHGQAMPEIDEIKDLLEHGDIRGLFTNEELEDCPRLSSSLVNIPTYISNGDCLPKEVIHALSKNKAAYKLVVDNYPDALLPPQPDDSVDEKEETSNGNTLTPPETVDEPSTGVKLKRKVSSLFKKRPANPGPDGQPSRRSILKKPPAMSVDEPFANTTVLKVEDDVFNNADKKTSANPNSRNLNHLKLRRQSLTYRGAMLNIHRYRLRASSCPDIYRNSMTTIAQEEEEGTIWLTCLQGIKQFFSDCCQWNFFNPSFLVFCVSNFILYAWYDVMYVYLVDYAEQDLHLPDSTYLISMIGLLNTIGEVIIGWVGDQTWMNMNLLYAVCMLACGFSTAVVPFLTRYAHLAAMAGIYGFAISANYSLTSPILVELVSLEQFSNAYGLLLLVQGISNLVGPPFAGYLYDITKKWFYTFGLGGIFIAFSGFLLLAIPCLKRARRLRQRHCSNNSGASHTIVDTEVTLRPERSRPIDIQRRVDV